LLNIQKLRIDLEKKLPGGIVYSQLIDELEDKKAIYLRKMVNF
jgi:hypothetical protein